MGAVMKSPPSISMLTSRLPNLVAVSTRLVVPGFASAARFFLCGPDEIGLCHR